MQVARTTTKNAAVQCDGDSDKSSSDEGDCNAACTDDGEERDDGDDVDGRDVEPKSLRKGAQNEFHGEAVSTVIELAEEIRKDHECAFKCAGWEVPKTNVSHATWERPSSRASRPTFSRQVHLSWQLTKVNGCTQQNNLVEVHAQALALKHLHDAMRTFDETMDSMKIVRASLMEEKTAY